MCIRDRLRLEAKEEIIDLIEGRFLICSCGYKKAYEGNEEDEEKKNCPNCGKKLELDKDIKRISFEEILEGIGLFLSIHTSLVFLPSKTCITLLISHNRLLRAISLSRYVASVLISPKTHQYLFSLISPLLLLSPKFL